MPTAKLAPLLLALGLAVSACKSKPPAGAPPGDGKHGSGDPAQCETLRPRLETLYRVPAAVATPERVDETVADNVAMVLRDCRLAPDSTIACVQNATTVDEIEQTCLIQLDDEGSEGDAFLRR